MNSLEKFLTRLEKRADECLSASATGKDKYLAVVTKLTKQDGVLMHEAVSVIKELIK